MFFSIGVSGIAPSPQTRATAAENYGVQRGPIRGGLVHLTDAARRQRWERARMSDGIEVQVLAQPGPWLGR
jgi:hypothetical protein